jgi:hypothetical protein
MPELTLLQAIGNATLRPIVVAWATRVRVIDQIQFLLDLNAHKPAKYLFTTYIAVGAPNLLNIAEATLRPIRALAARGDEGYAQMGKPLADTGKVVLTFMQGTFESAGPQGFMESKEYLGYRVGSRNPAVAAAVQSLKLPVAKANQFNPLLKVYLNARTNDDAYAAYVAMQKIVAKAKLDPALTAAGKPVAPIQRDHEVSKLAAALRPDVVEARRYLETALAAVKTKGKPGNPVEVTRMFNTGRQRVEKVTTAYTTVVRLDSGFAGKYGSLAADKKKVDEHWAEYRRALGK